MYIRSRAHTNAHVNYLVFDLVACVVSISARSMIFRRSCRVHGTEASSAEMDNRQGRPSVKL